MSYYPVFLNINGRKCVVVGGGQVALRKVLALLDCGASVQVISPELCSDLSRLAESGKMSVVPRRYRDGDLKGAFVVIAATSSRETNADIVSEARSRGVLVNVVDDGELSDFIVPSTVRRGDVVMAVSTGGKSPALARKIRTALEGQFGEEYASLVRLVDEVRGEMKHAGQSVDGDAWQEALDMESILDLLKRGERERARSVLLGNLKKTKVS